MQLCPSLEVGNRTSTSGHSTNWDPKRCAFDRIVMHVFRVAMCVLCGFSHLMVSWYEVDLSHLESYNTAPIGS